MSAGTRSSTSVHIRCWKRWRVRLFTSCASRMPRPRPSRNRMLLKRIIPCLDTARGRVVKGTHFKDLRDQGDPVALARLYSDDGADELTFLDIDATPQGRATLVELVERTAHEVFIPLTV